MKQATSKNKKERQQTKVQKPSPPLRVERREETRETWRERSEAEMGRRRRGEEIAERQEERRKKSWIRGAM